MDIWTTGRALTIASQLKELLTYKLRQKFDAQIVRNLMTLTLIL